jgi:hypothetical protein
MNTQPNNPNPPNAPDPLAVALSKLDPAPHGFEWNALMFAAGRESKTRALAFWRVAAGVCALAACGFAFAYFASSNERIVYIERAPARQGPQVPVALVPPVPDEAPRAQPAPPPVVPVPAPSAPSPSAPEPSGWTFDVAPPQGAATKWFNTRNEVLTVGLSVLPDAGRTAAPPREK